MTTIEPPAAATSLRLRSGQILAATRTLRGLSQGQVAARIGVHRSAVSHWETGLNPRVDPVYARRLARALSTDLNTLFTVDPDLESTP